MRKAPKKRRNTAKNQLWLGVFLICVTIAVAALVVSREMVPERREAAVAPVVGQFDVISIPVPTDYVPAGKKGREIKFRHINFPTHQVPQGALVSTEAIQDAVTVAPLPANLPLFHENFSHSGAVANPVIERIPPGMRAMTIRVDATSSVEGWAGSGSIVDVLLIEKDRTTVVAEKVKILSAERSVAPVEGQATPSVPTTVTVLVTQEQCLAVNTAIPRGRIAFALRSTKDDDTWESTVFTAEKLKGLAATTEKRAVVTGYIEVQERDNKRSFALADGKWTKTQVVPDGFLVGSRPSVE